jgi:hypothetical protein
MPRKTDLQSTPQLRMSAATVHAHLLPWPLRVEGCTLTQWHRSVLSVHSLLVCSFGSVLPMSRMADSLVHEGGALSCAGHRMNGQSAVRPVMAGSSAAECYSTVRQALMQRSATQIPSVFKDSQHVCAIVNRTHMAQHESEHAVTFVGHRKAVVATRYAVSLREYFSIPREYFSLRPRVAQRSDSPLCGALSLSDRSTCAISIDRRTVLRSIGEA